MKRLQFDTETPAMRARRGFTLVELMVAMALTLFVMAILSQAFVTGIDTFTGLKGIGDMQEGLRVASNNLHSDLRMSHFDGSRRLSDDASLYGTPKEGFFLVLHPSPPNYPNYPYPAATPPVVPGPTAPTPPGVLNPPYAYEGFDSDTYESARAVDHILNFTCRLTGNRRENYFRATLADDPTKTPPPGAPFSPFAADQFVRTQTHPYLSAPEYNDATQNDLPAASGPNPVQTYKSQWAEVAYYLERTGSTEEPENPTSVLGLPTYALRRAQYVIVPFDAAPLPTPPFPPGMTIDQLFGFTAASTAPYKEPFPGYYVQVFADMACNANPNTKAIDFYKPGDLASPAPLHPTYFQSTFLTRVALTGSPTNPFGSPLLKGSLVLPNVLSFRVQLLRRPLQAGAAGGAIFTDVIPPLTPPYSLGGLAPSNQLAFPPYNPAAMSYPYCIAPFNAWNDTRACYDSRVLPNNANGVQGGPIYGIQINLRVWDSKTRQTRQLTIIQDL